MNDFQQMVREWELRGLPKDKAIFKAMDELKKKPNPFKKKGPVGEGEDIFKTLFGEGIFK